MRSIRLARFLPLTLLAACHSVADQSAGTLRSDMDMAAFREQMAAVAEPGPEHEELQTRVGDWDLVVKIRAGGQGEWREQAGKSNVRVALDGRYIVEELTGSVDGRAFHGYQVMGFSRLERRYFSVWMDTHSTWPLASSGEMGESGVLRLSGRVRDVATPAGRPFHIDETRVSNDEYLREVYDTIDGEPVKVLEIRRKRRR